MLSPSHPLPTPPEAYERKLKCKPVGRLQILFGILRSRERAAKGGEGKGKERDMAEEYE